MRSPCINGVAAPLLLSIALAGPVEAGVCDRFLCVGQQACHAAKRLGQEIVATHGARIFVRHPHGSSSTLLKKLGIKVVPTLFSMTLLISAPAWWVVDSYVDSREEQAIRQIEVLIDNDLRFETLAIAKAHGTLDPESISRAGIALKTMWENYAFRLLEGPLTRDNLWADLPTAEQGDFPFQSLDTVMKKGRSKLTADQKLVLVKLTHEYNLRLILLNVLADQDASSWQRLRAAKPHLVPFMKEMEDDAFIMTLATFGKTHPEWFLRTYRTMQEDALNQYAIRVGAAVGIRQAIGLKELREELMRESGLPSPLK